MVDVVRKFLAVRCADCKTAVGSTVSFPADQWEAVEDDARIMLPDCCPYCYGDSFECRWVDPQHGQ